MISLYEIITPYLREILYLPWIFNLSMLNESMKNSTRENFYNNYQFLMAIILIEFILNYFLFMIYLFTSWGSLIYFIITFYLELIFHFYCCYFILWLLIISFLARCWWFDCRVFLFIVFGRYFIFLVRY